LRGAFALRIIVTSKSGSKLDALHTLARLFTTARPEGVSSFAPLPSVESFRKFFLFSEPFFPEMALV
jgi:hypothetical protein